MDLGKKLRRKNCKFDVGDQMKSGAEDIECQKNEVLDYLMGCDLGNICAKAER
jgi:hypothetical protein